VLVTAAMHPQCLILKHLLSDAWVVCWSYNCVVKTGSQGEGAGACMEDRCLCWVSLCVASRSTKVEYSMSPAEIVYC
jgi:hypothetical protein